MSEYVCVCLCLCVCVSLCLVIHVLSGCVIIGVQTGPVLSQPRVGLTKLSTPKSRAEASGGMWGSGGGGGGGVAGHDRKVVVEEADEDEVSDCVHATMRVGQEVCVGQREREREEREYARLLVCTTR